KGVTVFDAPATKGHTVKAGFSDCPRFKSDTAYTWPVGPGAKSEDIDMRQMAARYRKSSDFSTNLMDPKREKAWFSAMNPKQGLMLAYVWDRADYPWLGIWEENYGRAAAPWAGKSLTRGMEFSNTPWAQSLRDAVNLGTFHGQPTFRWLPARGSLTFKYAIIMLPVEKEVKAVHDICPSKRGFEVALEI
ncbi:MAG: hypothetical protein O3C57_08025, partial [Verrucomicrobia bacterium]|nr:hypothetical protein [Verrucomicrobiota bacterium]